jgi:hypothetical protein
VAKIDPVAAQLFGRTPLGIKNLKLSKLLHLPAGLKLADLVRRGPKGGSACPA